jgi:phosphoribosylformylglycinamidine synthase
LQNPEYLYRYSRVQNCEYDSAKAFINAGAEVKHVVFKNLTANDILESAAAYAEGIKKAQILMFVGGFFCR